MNDLANKNPLQDLLVDEEEIKQRADSILSVSLKPYVEIVQSSGEIQFTEAAYKLPNKEKILLVLGARLALKRLKKIDEDSMSQKELIDFLAKEGVPEGSVKSQLKKLKDDKVVAHKGSKYFVPLDKLLKLEKILQSAGT